MRTLIQKLFFEHWQRKGLSCLLALVIWLAVNHSLTSTKTIGNIPIRIINVPAGKTVEGLQTNGMLSKRIVLTLVGNKTLLSDLNPNDLEVVIDAADKSEEWMVALSKKNLISLNPDIQLSKGVSRLSHPTFPIRLTNLVTEKIPVLVTQPIGEAPHGYQFLDVWPYKLTLSVGGPEEMIKQLKAKGLKLTFNLNDIKKTQLDALAESSEQANSDVVSFYVPGQWKQVSLPHLSDMPFEINDAQAKELRIDFVRCNLLPIEKPIPLSLFVPPEFGSKISIADLKITSSSFIEKKDGCYLITSPLFAKGVTPTFLKIVRDMLQLVVVVVPKSERSELEWSLQFLNPRVLEDKYVSALLADSSDDEIRDLQPGLREEYLRNRFRSYMNRFQLYWSDDAHLDLKVELRGETVYLHENNPTLAHVDSSVEK